MKIFNVLSTTTVDKLMQLKRAAQGTMQPQSMGGKVDASNSPKGGRVAPRKGNNKGVSITPEMRAEALKRGVILVTNVWGGIREINLPQVKVDHLENSVGQIWADRIKSTVYTVGKMMEVVAAMLVSLRRRPSGLDKNGVRFL